MASCQVHDHCPECGDPVVPCDDAAINRAVGSMMDAMNARAIANIEGGDAPSIRDMVAGAYRYYWIPVQDRFLGETDPKRRAELLEGKKATRKGSPPNLDLYELRHFCGSMLADRGLSARDIAHQLGNSPQVCEEVYIHTHRDRALERLRGAFAQPAPVKRLPSREHFGSERADNA